MRGGEHIYRKWNMLVCFFVFFLKKRVIKIRLHQYEKCHDTWQKCTRLAAEDRDLSNHSVKYWDCILHLVFLEAVYLTSSPLQILPLKFYNVQLGQSQKTEEETTGMKKWPQGWRRLRGLRENQRSCSWVCRSHHAAPQYRPGSTVISSLSCSESRAAPAE